MLVFRQRTRRIQGNGQAEPSNSVEETTISENPTRPWRLRRNAGLAYGEAVAAQMQSDTLALVRSSDSSKNNVLWRHCWSAADDDDDDDDDDD